MAASTYFHLDATCECFSTIKTIIALLYSENMINITDSSCCTVQLSPHYLNL